MAYRKVTFGNVFGLNNEFNNDIEFEETNKFSEEEDLRTLDVDQLTNRLEKSLSVSIDKVEKMLDRHLEASDIVRLCHIGIEIANAKCEQSNKSLSSTESEDSSPNETQADENTAKTPIQSSIPINLERRIREMEYSSHTGPPAEIDDNTKRWLVVGICLHRVLAAALRKYVEPVITNLYNSLKLSDQIDKQTYTGHLKVYGAVNFYLNYKPINNNKMPPGNRAPNYDYKVQNAVDLSKLFLETSMAHYKGFDESCDSSALLGIIVNTDKFPANVQIAAKDVRQEIRNRWTHCDFTEWNSDMYNWSLQKIEDFIYLLQLNKPEESQAIRDLNKWKTNDADIPEIERWRHNSKDFIKTDIFTNISGIIKENHCVLLTGVSGMGKTMTAHNIALQLCQEEGQEPLRNTSVRFQKIRKLDKDTQDQEIKKAYHREIRHWHSDIAGKFGDNEMAHDVIASYDILRNHKEELNITTRLITITECETKEQIVDIDNGWLLAGAIVGGVTATVFGVVANVSSTNIAGPFAQSLRDGISLENFTKYALSNKGSEAVPGTVTGFVEERLDDEQENRPMSNGLLSSTVGHITNQNNDERNSKVDRSDRRSHSKTFYGSAKPAHSSSILSTDSDIKTHSSSSGTVIHSSSSNSNTYAASSNKVTIPAISDRGTNPSSSDRGFSIGKRKVNLVISDRGTHSSRSDIIAKPARSHRGTHSSSSGKNAHSDSSISGTHSSSSDRSVHSGSSDRGTHFSSSDRSVYSASSINAASFEKDTKFANSCSRSDSVSNTDSECRVLDHELWLKWNKYTVKPKIQPS
ncbi:unnamed protein product [Mytilus edulis]|uniref:Novel STAND NTPase 3 domain-containing protein n=1 Tax=Mytilus edulis TaxID=6550 RepID=A0A8S3PNP0_MYTED|nr:unnamed protein product [Mytilus edulis]